MPLMRADTQFAVVEATLKGYGKWVSAHGKLPQQDVCIPFVSQGLINVNVRSRNNNGESWNLPWSLGRSA